MDSAVPTYALEDIYTNFVGILRGSVNLLVPKQIRNFHKFWWYQDLNSLKDIAIASCRARKDARKPRSGSIHVRFKNDELLYKKRIKRGAIQRKHLY